MSFCNYSKEYLASGKTMIDNIFITNYLPDLDADALKVYLYGLYLCQNPYEISLEEFCKSINMTKDKVENIFMYLEEFDLCQITSKEPFSIVYYPISTVVKSTKSTSIEKYTNFNKALQLLITDRMISASEYRVYMQLLEETSISQEALLIIVKFCTEIKGSKISYKYILKVANDFISRNIITEEGVEKELEYYFTINRIVKELFLACHFTKKTDFDDLNLYIKWVQKYGFTDKFILETAINRKASSMSNLSKILDEIYFNNDNGNGAKKKGKKRKINFEYDGQRDIDKETADSLVDNPDDVEV
ncbi:MAG: DnaD domain protein [Clostridia bacterium]|nr:DnaD domain protein [Clostridia bacterium]